MTDEKKKINLTIDGIRLKHMKERWCLTLHGGLG